MQHKCASVVAGNPQADGTVLLSRNPANLDDVVAEGQALAILET